MKIAYKGIRRVGTQAMRWKGYGHVHELKDNAIHGEFHQRYFLLRIERRCHLETQEMEKLTLGDFPS